jgi:predicted methyltransferase
MNARKLVVLAAGLLAASVAFAATDSALSSAISNPSRSAKAVARDKVRHPSAELTFFGIKPDMTVVELWHGGGYWTDILGPYLAAHGTYYVALNPPGNPEEDGENKKLREHLAAEKARVGTVHETQLGAGHFEIAPPGSADMVLTFRNLHNWMEEGYAEQALKACFTALKPGGVLGFEEHRASNAKPQDPKAKSGYVRQDYVIELAKKVGFVLDGSSEIDANPKDTKDYPQGVWSLPPTLAEGQTNRDKYLAIGESDNMVLKFRKPR